MSAGRYVFFGFFFFFGCLGMAMMAGGGSSDKVVVAAAPELTELGQKMEGAHSRGAVLFQYNDGEGYALCEGTAYLVSLGPKMKEVKLTSQESLNLSLCRKSPETGNYSTVQNIGGVDPGDYLFWGDTFRWTPYANAANMLVTNQKVEAEPVEEAVAAAPMEEPKEMSVEEQNTALSQVKFELSGSPAGNPALFIDSEMVALINPGSSVTLPLVGNDRCGVSLKLMNSGGEWEHACGFGCIEYGALIKINVEGDVVTIVLSSQLQ